MAIGKPGSATGEAAAGPLDRAALPGADAAGDAVYHVELGNTYLELGSLADAADAYRRAIQLDPTLAEAHYNLGTVLSGRKDALGAMAAYRRAIELRPDFFEALFNLGDTLSYLGLLDEAADCYRRAAELEPSAAGVHNNLGSTLIELGRHEEAVEVLQRAVTHAPDIGELHTNLGSALKHAGRFDEGLAAQRRAVDLSPESAEAHFNLGAALAGIGSHDAAESSYRQAIALQPATARLYTYLGSSLMAMNRHDEALALCDAFLAERPTDRSILAFKVVLLEETGESDAAQALADYDGMIRAVDIAAPDGFDDVDAFNAALVHHIVAHPSLVDSPRSHATVKGRHTGNLLVDPKGPFAAFEKMLWQVADEYRRTIAEGSSHPYLSRWPELRGLYVWSIVMGSEGHQVPHIHPGGWLSGVYYAELPTVIEQTGDRHEGWIEFGRPPSGFPISGVPRVKVFRPSEGRLFLFPSYFYHRTVPYHTDERRVSIAFDFLPDT